jgi:hypothetical protein
VHSNVESTEEVSARDLEKKTFYLGRSPLSGLGSGTRNPEPYLVYLPRTVATGQMYNIDYLLLQLVALSSHTH